MKKYFGFLIVLTLFVLGGAQANAAASIPGPCVSTATPSVTVLSPNGGEVYQAGQQITVKWISCNVVGNVIIELQMPTMSGNPGYQLAPALNGGTPNDGQEVVTLPTPTAINTGWSIMKSGPYYNIRITDISHNPLDSSDNLFTIKTSEPSEEAPYIKVVSPNGGETIDISNPVTITFKSNNPAPAKHYINLVDVTTDHAYSLDSLLGSYGLTLTQEQINQGEQSVTFSAPESIKLNIAHDYLIEICVKNICDKSDGTFKLVKTNLISVCGTSVDPSIKVVSPNGGETFVAGKPIVVTWTSCNISPKNKMSIGLYVSETGQHYYFAGPHSNFTANDGMEKFIIPTNIPTGKYTITVSTDISSVGPTVIDYSDNKFTVNNLGKIKPVDDVVNSKEIISSDSASKNIPGTGVLKKGIKNASVTSIQNALIKLGYSVTADGSFGPKTEGVIKEIQIKNNLKADGVVGPKTMLLFK